MLPQQNSSSLLYKTSLRFATATLSFPRLYIAVTELYAPRTAQAKRITGSPCRYSTDLCYAITKQSLLCPCCAALRRAITIPHSAATVPRHPTLCRSYSMHIQTLPSHCSDLISMLRLCCPPLSKTMPLPRRALHSHAHASLTGASPMRFLAVPCHSVAVIRFALPVQSSLI